MKLNANTIMFTSSDFTFPGNDEFGQFALIEIMNWVERLPKWKHALALPLIEDCVQTNYIAINGVHALRICTFQGDDDVFTITADITTIED